MEAKLQNDIASEYAEQSQCGTEALIIARYAALLDSIREGVMILGRNCHIVTVNRAFTTLTGYSPMEAIGTLPQLLCMERHDQAFYDAMLESCALDGQWQGLVWARRKGGEVYPARIELKALCDEHGEIVNYLCVFSDVGPLKHSEDQLRYIAHHDPLTKLPNRLSFHIRLEHTLRRAAQEKQGFALLFLDLDRFRKLNETLGPVASDELLQMVATRIQSCLRGCDLAARLGGDEFAVILDEIADQEDAARFARKISEAVAQPVKLQGRSLTLSASIGVSLYPRDGQGCEALLCAANEAMYRARTKGRNTYHFYTPKLAEPAYCSVYLEQGLLDAMLNRNLVLHYQPQIAAESGDMISVEALVRWQHPEMGLILPNEFIPLAEDTGLIHRLGEWVLRTACAQAKAWHDSGFSSLRVAVNVSWRQLADDRFVEQVRQALVESGLEPRFLELEMTENVLQSGEQSIDTLKAIKSLGVKLALDDFGTGYSSLSVLKGLPFDRVKIDRSFIRNLPWDASDQVIVRAIIAMGHSLNLRVTAEGVDSQHQRAFLCAEGCDEFQGELYSMPIPSEALARLLEVAKDSSDGPSSPKTQAWLFARYAE
jgi:diguanylate cyclase (GGDEF)-like protein/PAS domain S-box-containing protein